MTRTGYFEPVAVMPEYQRRGLGKVIMNYGLHHLKRRGGTLAIAHGFSEAANALYSSVLSPEHDCATPWEKILED